MSHGRSQVIADLRDYTIDQECATNSVHLFFTSQKGALQDWCDVVDVADGLWDEAHPTANGQWTLAAKALIAGAAAASAYAAFAQIAAALGVSQRALGYLIGAHVEAPAGERPKVITLDMATTYLAQLAAEFPDDCDEQN